MLCITELKTTVVIYFWKSLVTLKNCQRCKNICNMGCTGNLRFVPALRCPKGRFVKGVYEWRIKSWGMRPLHQTSCCGNLSGFQTTNSGKQYLMWQLVNRFVCEGEIISVSLPRKLLHWASQVWLKTFYWPSPQLHVSRCLRAVQLWVVMHKLGYFK